MTLAGVVHAHTRSLRASAKIRVQSPNLVIKVIIISCGAYAALLRAGPGVVTGEDTQAVQECMKWNLDDSRRVRLRSARR